ncbi:glycosyltransferase 87 family protein [Aequorivita marisscotiae]|uniref:Glycosyltransferase 87 family protein n=1 Tax=Aequorivita marisscotiae TaxID=3040348 RepID=A0ABY8L1A1_9FLAO|nr:glycosyltransferase 87 family protein [Aequorivita sp. Ant34-E75]WGF93861.1 glycosyltransferase 87 family protein [Aequorivita sp. Ant34-E75]
MNFIERYKIPLLFSIAAIVFYISFGYHLERSDFLKLISLYVTLFFIAYIFIERLKLNFWFLACLGIIFRLVFMATIPNLSQDFYRFLWDGRLLAQGISPYLFTPASSIALGVTIEQSTELINGMGSLNASHFSNYPPINQFLYTVAALISGKSILGSVIVFRVIMILADIGILYFGKRLLEKINLPVKNIFWYFLNPFIIIELTGNLHFEGVMLFFFIWALYLLFKGKWFWAAVLIAVSVSVKLIPLLFLPLFFKWFSKKEVPTALNLTSLLSFYAVIGLTILITFLPFLSWEFIQNFSATISLWFQSFEFNASVYYIIRWIGFQIVGWNIIGTAGKILPVLVLLYILAVALFRKNKTPQQLITAMLFAISVYFLLSTTVHPWYIATPLLLSVFTKYKFPIVWSFLIVLSYSAYGKNGFDEKLWLVAVEYILVFGFAIFEIIKNDLFNLKKRPNILKPNLK